MIFLISPAKTMVVPSVNYAKGEITSKTRFDKNTRFIIEKMRKYNTSELESIFKISSPLAIELKARFESLSFGAANIVPAIDTYEGVVYKHIKGGALLNIVQREYLQEYVRISSLMYGLLRPLDMIAPYRMEGWVRIEGSDERVDRYWREVHTDTLIEDVKSNGGVLVYVASKEEQNMFDWKRVKKSVRVVDIKFLKYDGAKYRQVIVYTKMARGEMVRWAMLNNINDAEILKEFEWESYRYRPDLSTENEWTWVMN